MGLDSVIEELGRLPHDASLALQRKATMLLVIGTRSRLRIPGKVIEYIGAGRPILCLSHGPGDLAAEFVKQHGLGIVVPNQTESIVRALLKLNALWQNGRLEAIYHPRNVEAFSWRSLARDLEEIFSRVSREHAGKADSWAGTGNEI
jgi:glycosyltransferase involved in cell wall biosynthesis